MTIFGSVGLVLVTIGVYSVLAYTTARRTHEIGIRMALGAEGTDVLGLVIKNGLRLVTTGVVIGLAASLTLSKLIAAQLWGVSGKRPGHASRRSSPAIGNRRGSLLDPRTPRLTRRPAGCAQIRVVLRR